MTTSHTPAYAFPYPEGDEYVIGGDDAIEALAKAVERALTPSYAVHNDHPLNLAANTPTDVDLPAPQAASADWSDDGASWVYSGPARAFLLAAHVTMTNTDGAATGDYLAGLTLKVDGASVVASEDRLQQAGGPITATVTNHIAHIVFLTPGDVITLNTYASRPSSGAASLAIYSVSPRLS